MIGQHDLPLAACAASTESRTGNGGGAGVQMNDPAAADARSGGHERLRRSRIGRPIGAIEIGAALGGKAKDRQIIVQVAVVDVPGRRDRAANAVRPQRLGQARDIDFGAADRVGEIGVRHVEDLGRGGGRNPYREGIGEFRQLDHACYPGADRKIGGCRRMAVTMRRDFVQQLATLTARLCPAISDNNSAS